MKIKPTNVPGLKDYYSEFVRVAHLQQEADTIILVTARRMAQKIIANFPTHEELVLKLLELPVTLTTGIDLIDWVDEKITLLDVIFLTAIKQSQEKGSEGPIRAHFLSVSKESLISECKFHNYYSINKGDNFKEMEETCVKIGQHTNSFIFLMPSKSNQLTEYQFVFHCDFSKKFPTFPSV
ncbi:MAG: hypothetical protein WDK96_00810 [Candidatus Paceibacterota bacterium]|jgi:hypothetical protein